MASATQPLAIAITIMAESDFSFCIRQASFRSLPLTWVGTFGNASLDISCNLKQPDLRRGLEGTPFYLLDHLNIFKIKMMLTLIVKICSPEQKAEQ